MGRNPCFLAEIGGIMRYIRTKDGVFESKATERGKFIHIPTNDAVAQMHRDNWVWVLEENIVAQADTIEELCDELVVCDPQFSLPFTRERAWGSLYLDTSSEEKFKKGKLEAVYGSIWVDGNLIKVAKMNEKGELELL